jgi:HSP20 family protein
MTFIRHHHLRHHPLHDELRQAFAPWFAERDAPASAAWTPRCDIREDAERFVILADLPGIDPKDIEIAMDKGILSIRGERAAEAKDEAERPSRRERAHGVFHRRFALPESADADGIVATGRHGVLEIAIPKRAAATPRRIQVQ